MVESHAMLARLVSRGRGCSDRRRSTATFRKERGGHPKSRGGIPVQGPRVHAWRLWEVFRSNGAERRGGRKGEEYLGEGTRR